MNFIKRYSAALLAAIIVAVIAKKIGIMIGLGDGHFFSGWMASSTANIVGGYIK